MRLKSGASGSGGGEQLGWPPGFQNDFGGDFWGDRNGDLWGDRNGDLWGERLVLGLHGEGEREFLRLAARLLLLLALPQGQQSE